MVWMMILMVNQTRPISDQAQQTHLTSERRSGQVRKCINTPKGLNVKGQEHL